MYLVTFQHWFGSVHHKVIIYEYIFIFIALSYKTVEEPQQLESIRKDTKYI